MGAPYGIALDSSGNIYVTDWMLGYSCAHDLPAIVGQNDHHAGQPKRRGRHNERIDGSDAFGVIPQQAAPGRGRRTSPSHHVLRDGRLADLDAELEQLNVDPGRALERVGAAHLPNQVTNLAVH
ncbi:SBBP repeat-containing protein [Candidatus Binatus soli]|uniref:SBBP repeat-containing protein n=1 Tax=Candidatus Binatus soli TaxID=1953413 RepID=UPI003D0BB371